MGSKTEEITSLQGVMDKFVEMANKERYDKLLRKNADLESSLTVHVHVHPVTAEHNSL